MQARFADGTPTVLTPAAVERLDVWYEHEIGEMAPDAD